MTIINKMLEKYNLGMPVDDIIHDLEIDLINLCLKDRILTCQDLMFKFNKVHKPNLDTLKKTSNDG